MWLPWRQPVHHLRWTTLLWTPPLLLSATPSLLFISPPTSSSHTPTYTSLAPTMPHPPKPPPSPPLPPHRNNRKIQIILKYSYIYIYSYSAFAMETSSMHTVAPRLYSISVNAVAKQSLSICTSTLRILLIIILRTYKILVHYVMSISSMIF